jgi:hypothetical protein
MERVKLRFREAEALIAKARDQAETRERKRAQSTSQGRLMPPDASLLGCWQWVELRILVNGNPDRFLESTLGECRFFFTTLTPDRRVFGTCVKTGGSTYLPREGIDYMWDQPRLTEIAGRIIGEGRVSFRSTPVGVVQVDRPNGRCIRRLPTINDVCWQGWEMEGEYATDTGGEVIRSSFKAVRIDDATAPAMGDAARF